jgi:DNA-binding transcriptional ArsR family regulator
MIEEALRAIAEPHRRQILKLVLEEERSAGDIASHFDVTRPAISQHLRVLQSAGLVNVRREGTKRIYHVRPAGLEELREFLSDFWGDGLARLKDVAEGDDHSSDIDQGGPL